MYQPNLVPRETHHLRMSELNSRGSRLDPAISWGNQTHNQRIGRNNNNTNNSNNRHAGSNVQSIYAPPLSSYSAAFLGPMKTTRTSEELFNLPMGSGQDQALDYISLEIANNLMHLKSLAYTGYNYIKPIGIGKTMKEMVENHEIRGISVEEDEEEDDENEVDDYMDQGQQSGLEDNSSTQLQGFVIQADDATGGNSNGAEIDLDAQIPDGDDFNLSYSNVLEDDEDASDDELRSDQLGSSTHLDLGGARRLLGSGNNGGFELDYREAHTSMARNTNQDEEFMAAEEYQDDHSISIDSSIIDGYNPETRTSGEVIANHQPTGSPTTATISANSMLSNSGSGVNSNNTNLTSPPTASMLLQYASYNNPYYTPSHLRNEQYNTSHADENESDYDMTIE